MCLGVFCNLMGRFGTFLNGLVEIKDFVHLVPMAPMVPLVPMVPVQNIDRYHR